VRDLRTRVASVLIPGAVIVVLGITATPTLGFYELGTIGGDELPLALVLCFVALAALATTVPREHLTLVLTLSTVGLSLAVVYALLGAPNVALVAVLIETLFALLFIGLFSLLPKEVLRREAAISTHRGKHRRDALIAIVAGGVTSLVVWGALSRPTGDGGVAAAQTRLAPEAHADNVVTAILVDFRGLDTLGEVTVVAVALLGVASLLRRGRLS
jgi:multicomponent Na+:H+ antiporter subunit A